MSRREVVQPRGEKAERRKKKPECGLCWRNAGRDRPGLELASQDSTGKPSRQDQLQTSPSSKSLSEKPTFKMSQVKGTAPDETKPSSPAAGLLARPTGSQREYVTCRTTCSDTAPIMPRETWEPGILWDDGSQPRFLARKARAYTSKLRQPAESTMDSSFSQPLQQTKGIGFCTEYESGHSSVNIST